MAHAHDSAHPVSPGCRAKPALPVHRDPEFLGGTPVVVGTRVPYQTLLDYLGAGDSLDEFLDDFPTVTRDQAIAALEVGKELVLRELHAA